jgi:GMP synthase-like glutamine amidotransferase
MHQDSVTRLPPDFENLGSSQLCEYQAMMSRNKKILSLQGHPEFTGGLVELIIK